MTILEDSPLGDTAIPYVAALDAALRTAGEWSDGTWMLAGQTGLAFQLVVDPKTCPSSPTAYDWAAVHAAAAARLGISTSCIQCIGDEIAYPGRREEALAAIKASIDVGRPAVVRTVDWAEFAVVHGYDDNDGVLFFDARHADPVLYANLGVPHGFPFLFAQTFGQRRPVDPTGAAASSLAYAVTCWRGDGFPKHPWYDFAVGAEGYSALIRALERRDTDPLGVRYVLRVHADARQCVSRYVRHLADEGTVAGVEAAAADYESVAPLVTRAAELLPSAPPFERPLEATAANEAAILLRRAAELEKHAVGVLEVAVARLTP